MGVLEIHRQVKVYPRVCGGTEVCYTNAKDTEGLSPRVRGNPTATQLWRPPEGSIPACAGEPRSCAPS